MNELTIPKDERPIVMRNGMVHFVSLQTWRNISEAIAQQSAHQFLTIAELGNIQINTADVTGVYTIDEYEDFMKIKEGMRQCAWRKWHGKREECQCRREAERRTRDEHRKRQEAEEYRAPTTEERARIESALKANRVILEAKGIIKTKSSTGYVLKRSALNAYKKTHGNAYRVPPGTEIVEDEPLSTH